MLNAIPCDDLYATADTITKAIHEAALLVAGRPQGKKPDKLLARTKMLWEKSDEERWYCLRQPQT